MTKTRTIKVMCIFGTRPEAIKMAPVIKEMEKHSDRIVVRICVTAQHRELLDPMLQLFGIIPNIDLNLMQPNRPVGAHFSGARHNHGSPG